MRLDARLQTEIAEVGLALFEPQDLIQPDDADLLALALGVATGVRRERCAQAVLASERAARRVGEVASHPLVKVSLALSPEDRSRRVIEAFLGDAERTARLLAEGLQEGETLLAGGLTGMRVGWRLADETGDHDAVARFAEALTAELMERGAWEELGELVELGHRAADALDRPGLRSRLLAYEGAGWSRRGDYARAARLWTERVVLNRRIGNPVGEADALMDLAGDALEQGDLVAWGDWTAQAQDAVERSGRANLSARLWTQRAHERLQAGELREASRFATHALDELSDASQVDVGLSTRLVAARVLARCGQMNRALADLALLLSFAATEGRPALVALVLEALGDVLEESDGLLASRCLNSALSIHRSLGTRRIEGLAEKVGQRTTLSADQDDLGLNLLVRDVLMANDQLKSETLLI